MVRGSLGRAACVMAVITGCLLPQLELMQSLTPIIVVGAATKFAQQEQTRSLPSAGVDAETVYQAGVSKLRDEERQQNISVSITVAHIKLYEGWEDNITKLGIDPWGAGRIVGPLIDEPIPRKRNSDDLVMETDYYIYSGTAWDSVPIVRPNSKLIFFTVPKVACTLFKQLFRRMMGYGNYTAPKLAHNPKINGLTYLSDYSIEGTAHDDLTRMDTRHLHT